MMKKSKLIFSLIFLSFLLCGYQKPEVYVIDAAKNATKHNNLGLRQAAEGNYYDAIEEFSIAIALNPKTQATSVYYNNLGETYMKIAYYSQAQRCFETAITQYSLNFLYYKNLVESFKARKLVKKKIKFYEIESEKNPLNMIVLGLLYVADGDTRRGIIKLDEFCMKEPDLLITGAVKSYIRTIVPKQ